MTSKFIDSRSPHTIVRDLRPNTAAAALFDGKTIETNHREILKLDSDGVLITQDSSGTWHRARHEFNTVVMRKFEVVTL